MWLKMLLTSLLVLAPMMGAHAAKVDIGSLRVDTTPTQHERDLINRSSLIVYGWTDSAHQKYPTGTQVPSGALVNFVQTIHVKQVLKGTSSQLIDLLTTGIEPVPDPNDPLNNRYPGPLAEGNYICFLKGVPGTELYSVVGVWQGVYPIVNGKTVALQGAGYSTLHHLSVQEMARQIKVLSQPEKKTGQ